MKIQNNIFIKSPLNYTGGKFKILEQIIPMFPKDINNFVDLFAGGGDITANVNAKKIFMNDNLTYLIDLYIEFRKLPYKYIIEHIYKRIDEYKLSLENEDGYNNFRNFYNQNKNPLDLFVLISFSFNHQIRFNNSHKFNNPFGKLRSSFNNSIKNNLELFIKKMKSLDIVFSKKDFGNFNLNFLSENDFVYLDPPYLISTGTYNDGKRGFSGWNKNNEILLLEILDNLNRRKIKFALSNFTEHGGNTNTILKEWIIRNNYKVNIIFSDYKNSSYRKSKLALSKTNEVLITNYTPSDYKTSNSFSFMEM